MRRMTREAFHRFTATQPRRFERVCGEPVAMAPERVIHAQVKARVWAALDRAVRTACVSCQALPDGVTVEIGEDTDYEPDAIVNCGPIDPDGTAAPNPVIVVEVLSPGTASVDTGHKFADYFKHPAINHYLIVRPQVREVIHHRRMADGIESRIVNVGTLTFDPPNISVDIADFYAAR